jgi:replicative DNA helicase
VKCTVVDYIQNIPRTDGKEGPDAIEEACRTMQRISREMGHLVIMVSQVTSAASRERRPMRPEDCVGSAAIKQVSDMMVGVHRPSVWEDQDNYETAGRESWAERRTHAQLDVAKNKFGPQGMVNASFDGATFKFSDARTGRFS